MKPEIKFRTYNYYLKKMDYEPYGDEFLGEGTPVNRVLKTVKEVNNCTELMQFIGFNDKNNISIYEDDIVKHGNNLYVVRWTNNFGYIFISTNTFSYSNLLLESHNWRSYNWGFRIKKYIEIVGNLHENKDLLNHFEKVKA